MTSTFNAGTDGCGGCGGFGGWYPSGFGGGCGGHIFVLHSNNLPNETLSLASFTSSHNYSTNFLVSLNNCDYILTDYTLAWFYQGPLQCLLMCC